MSMVGNQLKSKAELQEKMLIVWLGEDDVVTSLVDLVLLMLENLVRTDPLRFNKDCLKQAQGQKPETVAEIIMHSMTEQIAGNTLLLVKENMSDVFKGLKDSGQKKLRAYLQENNNMAILASSQQLFPGVSSRESAFFGFFDTYHLEVLSVEDAKQLISNIAALNGNQALVDFLTTPQGGYRVRALHHLAGGNHRLYVELAAFLTMESLNDFVSALVKLTDNLTPYFQERVRALPAQQGRIVQKLCEIQGATPVKSIAESTFIGERSVAKQLGDLAKKGYVISHKRGKESYYEMAEPLMRLALEVKNNQGKPLKMVAQLLRIWFSDAELKIDQGSGVSADYRKAALSMDKEVLASINSKIAEEMLAAFKSSDYEKAITVSSEIIDSPYTNGPPLIKKADALFARSFAYRETGEKKLELQDCLSVISMNVDHELTFKSLAYFMIPVIYFELLEIDNAHKALEEALEKGDKESEFCLLVTKNILELIIRLGGSHWQKQIIWIADLYNKYEVIENLGIALIQSIAFFVEDESIASSFKKWQQLWQQHREQYPEMELPLQVLQAAVLAVEQKNDKPLLSLPKEIRDLVLPLLDKVIN